MDQEAAQAAAACGNAIDLAITVPLQPGFDVRIFGDEVRVPRITNDKIGDLLIAKPDPGQMIAGNYPSPLELVL